MSAQVVRSMRLDVTQSANVFGRDVLDARQRHAASVEANGLQTIEWLVFRQTVGQPVEIQNVAPAARHADKRRRGPGRANRHEGRPRRSASIGPQELAELLDGWGPEQGRKGQHLAEATRDR